MLLKSKQQVPFVKKEIFYVVKIVMKRNTLYDMSILLYGKGGIWGVLLSDFVNKANQLCRILWLDDLDYE